MDEPRGRTGRRRAAGATRHRRRRGAGNAQQHRGAWTDGRRWWRRGTSSKSWQVQGSRRGRHCLCTARAISRPLKTQRAWRAGEAAAAEAEPTPDPATDAFLQAEAQALVADAERFGVEVLLYVKQDVTRVGGRAGGGAGGVGRKGGRTE